MSWINKSMFAWLYYNLRKSDKYSDIDNYKQRQQAERALAMAKSGNKKQLLKAKEEYLKEAEAMIDKIIEEKSPKPKGEGEQG